MRLIIDLDEKFKNLFLEAAKAANASVTVDEADFWKELPRPVRDGIEKSLEQIKEGKTKSYQEVKRILANR